MKIKVGKYTINSDKFCLWITEPVICKRKDGTEYEGETKVAGYSANFRQLLESFASYKARDNEITTVKEALQNFAEIERDIWAIIKEVNKNALSREA